MGDTVIPQVNSGVIRVHVRIKNCVQVSTVHQDMSADPFLGFNAGLLAYKILSRLAVTIRITNNLNFEIQRKKNGANCSFY